MRVLIDGIEYAPVPMSAPQEENASKSALDYARSAEGKQIAQEHPDGGVRRARAAQPASEQDVVEQIAIFKAQPEAILQLERVRSRLAGIEDGISAFSDKSLMDENERLIAAIDEQMVSCHLGVFNPGDDPIKSINRLMCWAQGVGEYFALHDIDEDDRKAWLKTPMLSSSALTSRSERDANAILANRRARSIGAPVRAQGMVSLADVEKAIRENWTNLHVWSLDSFVELIRARLAAAPAEGKERK